MLSAAAPARSSTNASDAYRRQARRLRCLYAAQPDRLQRSLQRLAVQVSTAAAPPGAVVALAPAPAANESPFVSSARGGAARRFAAFLTMRTPSTDLRYSERLELIRIARRFGVGRFEANLLIAAVLERRRSTHRARSVEPSAGRRGSVLASLAVFIVVQGAFAVGTWWALFR